MRTDSEFVGKVLERQVFVGKGLFAIHDFVQTIDDFIDVQALDAGALVMGLACLNFKKSVVIRMPLRHKIHQAGKEICYEHGPFQQGN